MIAFFILLFVLIVIYTFMTTNNATNVKEGFDPVNTEPSHTVQIPVNKIPAVTPALTSDEVSPHTLPGQLPVAPYQQIAAMSPLPYQDTTLIKANRQQLVDLLEMLKGFLAFEAQEISERSDPSIQLPLATARSDFSSIQSEVEVLNRNPGIQPTMTLSHLNEVYSNLAYLQQQVRLLGASGAIQGPIYEFTKPIEGFQTAGMQGSAAATPQMGQTNSIGLAPTIVTPSPYNQIPQLGSGHVAVPLGQSNSPAVQNTGPNQPASTQDLKNFVSRIQGEIIRLSASGTNDPVMTSRVAALTKMKVDVQTILDQLKAGTMMEVEIPIKKSDIDKALPVLGNPSEPLPQLITTLGLPMGLANVLPSNMQKDPNTTKQINSLIDKYADKIVNGLSASFAVSYTSPNEMESKRSINSTIDKTGFPSMMDLNQLTGAAPCPTKNAKARSRSSVSHGGQHSQSHSQSHPMQSNSITDPLAGTPADAGRGPAHFDWKQRAKEIESQVSKRGLNPTDFGIMQKNSKVSDDFSWKGYARMICTRLQATMDPSLPETCGCPPMDWKGWRGTF
jgi:hypothetical protein